MERFAHAAAARAAIVNLTRTLALEWGEHGILVNAVGPGPIMTEGIAQYDESESGATRIHSLPVPRWGEPREVAQLVTYLLSPAADWITGVFYPIDGGAQLVGRRWET
jgi:NAD(P)-dependent dehydrogenase (short-subunit alcohol dehydrogenase family)